MSSLAFVNHAFIGLGVGDQMGEKINDMFKAVFSQETKYCFFTKGCLEVR